MSVNTQKIQLKKIKTIKMDFACVVYGSRFGNIQ